jgi:NAD(P)-dependent dehydrogenase (short-subunit alcohol dehydrogenase family)
MQSNNYLESIFSLKNKTAIITGGSKGIGAEIVLAFIKAGANVVCISRSESTIKKHPNFSYYKCNVSNSKQFQSICESINTHYEGIDVLVNAAGISLPVDDKYTEIERFSETLSVNLLATYQCCETASKFMNENSSIINITSIGSMLGFPNNPGYIASKGGVMALTKALAIDLSPKSIRVNNIVPGYIKTDMTHKSFKDKKMYNERLDRMIIKRWGSVKDITGAAIFLASDSSSYVTGTDVIIDGGWTAKGI